MKEIWKRLEHPSIFKSYEISCDANFRIIGTTDIIDSVYESSNGYNFIRLLSTIPTSTSIHVFRYFPIDDLVAITFVKCPDELIGKPVKVEHIDGNLRNNHYENLRWVEDIEEWRDIPDNTIYQISNWGNIRNKETMKYLSGSVNNYKYVGIKNCKTRLVHQLVAEAFVTKVENKLHVNHINEIKTDNYYKNLEYVNITDNLEFGNHNLNVAKSMGSKVICIETGIVYRSTKEAGECMGISSSSILECCFGSRKSAHNYTFRWFDRDIDVSEKKMYAVKLFGKKVRCIETGIVYDSIAIASREMQLNRKHISECCNNKRKRTGGYHFEFVEEVEGS